MPCSLARKTTNLEAARQALQRRCVEAEDAAGRRRRQTEEVRDRLQQALDEISSLREACAGKERMATEARAEARQAAERLATDWGREKAELKASNESLAKRTVSERTSRGALQVLSGGLTFLVFFSTVAHGSPEKLCSVVNPYIIKPCTITPVGLPILYAMGFAVCVEYKILR